MTSPFRIFHLPKNVQKFIVDMMDFATQSAFMELLTLLLYNCRREEIFSLRLLPHDVKMNVLKSMDVPTLILISYCSKKLKSLVKSLNLNVTQVAITLIDQFEINLKHGPDEEDIRLVLCINEVVGAKRDLKTMISNKFCVETGKENEEVVRRIRLKRPGVGARQLLDHCLDTLNFHSPIDLIFSDREGQYYSTESMVETLKGLHIRLIRMYELNNFRDVINMFPKPKSLELHFEEEMNESDRHFMMKVLMENHDYVVLSKRISINLDTLLIINSSMIEIFNSMFSDNDLNKFLKCWMLGSNPRLKFLSLEVNEVDPPRVLEDEDILRGIKHDILPLDEEKTVVLLSKGYNYTNGVAVIEGGYEIKRKDGVKATLLVFEDCFEMFVWN